MAFLANKNSQFNLAQTLTLTANGNPWSLTLSLATPSVDGLLMGGPNVGGTDPYFGWFGGKPAARLGANSASLTGSFTAGQTYNWTLSNNGAGQTTIEVNGVSASFTQTVDVVINVFLRYQGSFDSGVKYTGLVGGVWTFTGIPGGTRTYNWEQAPGSTTLPDTTGGNTATLVGTGSFQATGDVTPPVITLLGDNPLTLEQGTAYVEPGFTATDDTDGNITANVVVGGDTVDENVIATYSITYNVSDAAGNAAAQQVRTVNIIASGQDITPPVITLLGANPLTLEQGTPYSEPGFTASDNVDGDVTANVIVTGTIDENTISQQSLSYSVQDAAGNNTTVQRVVNVVAPAVGSITIESVTDFQCKPRDVNGQAVFTIAGSITGATGPVEVSVGGAPFTTLDAGTATTFTGNVTITNQQDVTVRLASSPGTTDTVQKLSAAMVIVEGPSQSNGAGRGLNPQTYSVGAGKPTPVMWKAGTGFAAVQDPTGDDGNPALGGSVWPHIAQQYIDRGIPVCIGNVAVGGTLIAQWAPGAPEAYYNRITAFADACGGLSFITTCIGESDAQASTGITGFKAGYLAVVNPLIAAYDCDVYLTYTVKGDATSGRLFTQIYPANDQLIAENARILFGGNLSVIDINTTTATGNDGLHLKQDADLQWAADIRYNAFNGHASSAEITMAGAPDGQYDVVVYEVPAVGSIDLNTPVAVTQVNVVNEKFHVYTPAVPGTEIVGLLPGDNPPQTGGAIHGVTR